MTTIKDKPKPKRGRPRKPSDKKPPSVGRLTGRPTKLTPQVVDKICQHIRDGSYIKTACLAAGITQSTYTDWMRHAISQERDGKDTRYTQFLASVKLAEAELEARLSKRVVDISEKQAIPTIVYMSRRFRDNWAEVRPEDMQKGNGSVQINVITAPASKPALPPGRTQESLDKFDGGYIPESTDKDDVIDV